jgi:hydrogenase maturation protease
MMDTGNPTQNSSPGMIKVIGLGQCLRGDDAAGLEAVKLWQATCQINSARKNVQVELAGLPGLGLLNLLDGSQAAILVDAVHSSSPAGTVHVLSENEIAAFTGGFASSHGWGVAETLAMGRLLIPSDLPKKLVLIGIEASQLYLGEGLSPQVRSALPEAVRLVEQNILGEIEPG